MEAKHKAIQAAYGDSWEKVKEFVKSDAGWCEPGYDKYFLGQIEIEPYGTDRWRPKSLSGIENNNGWIRFNEQLPEDDRIIRYCIGGVPEFYSGDSFQIKMRYEHFPEKSKPSHWKYIEEPKPPIY